MSFLQRRVRQLAALVLLLLAGHSQLAMAGADVFGVVNALQVAPDGKLWFSIVPGQGSPSPGTYCKLGWAGLGMYVSPDNPQYAFYYGLLLASLTKGAGIYVANVSVFNASTPCDISQTGYGLMLQR